MKTATAETEKPITLNPLAIANGRIIEAKRDAREHGVALTEKWKAHRNSAPIIPADMDLRERAAREMAHYNQGQRLRSEAQNFAPQNFESSLLDTADNKAVLEAALRHVRQLHSDHLKRPTPIAAKVETDGGRHLFQGGPVEPEPAWPPPRPQPQGGLFGQPAPLDIVKELASLEAEIEAFPNRQAYEQVVARLNAVHSAIVALNPESKPAPALRQDRGWTVPSHM